MQNKISLSRKSMIAIMLCMTFLLGYLPFSADKAYAADGSITLKVGRKIDYSSHFTHYFYAGDKDNLVYCAQPQLATPKSGTYSYSFIKPESMLAKCLYYGYGGPGFAEYTDKQLSGQWNGDDDAYCLTHIIIAIAYDKTTSEDADPFRGLTDAWKNKAKSLYEYVKGLPAPPVNYRAYQIKVAGCQDILGSFNDTGSISLHKASFNPAMTEGNSNYSIAGAKYGVYYGNTLIGTITTDANGAGKLENVLVGNYTVKEISPSRGYAIEVSGHNVSVKVDQVTDISVKEIPQSNPMDILLGKFDSETGKADPQGAASLKGAEFQVDFYAESSAPRAAKSQTAADRTWVFRTDGEGRIKFTKDYLVSGDDFYYQSDGETICMPLGKVVITEIKAPEGYLINGEIFTAYITPSGVKETVLVYNEQSVPEQVKRGDLEMVKVSDGDQKRLANVPFTITSLTTGESHTIMTDKNGYASTAATWNRHTHNTNAGKTSEDGIWFGEAEPDDSKGALIYDDYEVAEQRCEANQGMKLLKIKVSVYKDSVTIPMGTMTDDRIEIGTTATYDTGQKVSKAEGHVTIEDVVRYSGLQAGKTYLIKGKLIDKSTGMPLLVDGKEVVSEKEFTAENSSGEVMVSFTFDASALSSRKIVVFENLYEDDTEIAAHADIADEGQTVSLESDYPSNSPKTGDDTKLYVLFALMVAAGLAATAVQVVRKKKHSKAQKEIEE